MELFLGALIICVIAFGLIKGFDFLGTWWDEHGSGNGFGAVIAAIIGTGVMIVLIASLKSAAGHSP